MATATTPPVSPLPPPTRRDSPTPDASSIGTNTKNPPTSPSPASCQCRWDWCTETFSTRTLLRQHVERDHIPNLAPVRAGDLKIWRRAEGSSGGDSSTFLRIDSQSWPSSGEARDRLKEKVDRGVMTDNLGDRDAVAGPSTPTRTSPPVRPASALHRDDDTPKPTTPVHHTDLTRESLAQGSRTTTAPVLLNGGAENGTVLMPQSESQPSSSQTQPSIPSPVLQSFVAPLPQPAMLALQPHTRGGDAEMMSFKKSMEAMDLQLASVIGGGNAKGNNGDVVMDIDPANMDTSISLNLGGNRDEAAQDLQWRPESQLPLSINPSQLQRTTQTQHVLPSSPVKLPTQSQDHMASLVAVTSTPHGQSRSPGHLHAQTNSPLPGFSSSTLDIYNLTGSRPSEFMFTVTAGGRTGGNVPCNASSGLDMNISEVDLSSSNPFLPSPDKQHGSQSHMEPSMFSDNLGVSDQSNNTPLKSTTSGLDRDINTGWSQEYDPSFVSGSGGGVGVGGEAELQTQVMGVGAFGASWESDG